MGWREHATIIPAPSPSIAIHSAAPDLAPMPDQSVPAPQEPAKKSWREFSTIIPAAPKASAQQPEAETPTEQPQKPSWRDSAQIVAPTKAPVEDTISGRFKSGLVGAIQATPEVSAQGLKAIGGYSGIETISKAGEKLEEIYKAPKSELKPLGFSNIKSIGDAARWLAELSGSGVGSTLPSVAGSLAGAIIGGTVAGPIGATRGAFTGAAPLALIQNVGDLRGALIENGVPEAEADKLALPWGAVITVPDVFSAGKIGTALTGGIKEAALSEIKKNLVKRLATAFFSGAKREAGTEAGQQVVQEGVVSSASPTRDFLSLETAENVITAGVGGFAGGGLFEAPAGFRKPQTPIIDSNIKYTSGELSLPTGSEEPTGGIGGTQPPQGQNPPTPPSTDAGLQAEGLATTPQQTGVTPISDLPAGRDTLASIIEGTATAEQLAAAEAQKQQQIAAQSQRDAAQIAADVAQASAEAERPAQVYETPVQMGDLVSFTSGENEIVGNINDVIEIDGQPFMYLLTTEGSTQPTAVYADTGFIKVLQQVPPASSVAGAEAREGGAFGQTPQAPPPAAAPKLSKLAQEMASSDDATLTALMSGKNVRRGLAAKQEYEKRYPGLSQGAEIKSQIVNQEQQVNVEPTQAQIEAGNYKKGHVRFKGLDISIENPAGSVRRGVDANGKAWEATLPATYGYFKGTEAIDGDHVDVYIGDNPDSDKVWVIDQVDPETKKYDEPKTMVGFNDIFEATDAYEAAFSDGKGKARIGAITEMDMNGLKSWLNSDKTKKPMSYVEPIQKRKPALPTVQPTSTSVQPTSVDVKKQEPKPTVEKPKAKPSEQPKQEPVAPEQKPSEPQQAVEDKKSAEAKKKRALNKIKMKDVLEVYFKTGNIVSSYGGKFDRVVSFNWNDGNWTVTVEAVKKSESGEWFKDGPNRTHATMPSTKDVLRIKESLLAQQNAAAPTQKAEKTTPKPEPQKEIKDEKKYETPAEKAEKPAAEKDAYEEKFGRPEDMTPQALGKLDKKLQGMFQSDEAKALSDEEFATFEAYARRVEEAKSKQKAAPVGKPAATTETVKAEVLRQNAKPVLDLSRNPTGWLQVTDSQNNVALIHPTEPIIKRFTSGYPRAEAEAQAYAIDNPIEKKTEEKVELIVKPLIQKKPRAKQEGIEDVGEKIGGAKKDKWRNRGLTLEDLSGMTGGEQATNVKKNNVWPKPDYAAMIESGVDKKAAALIKIIRDRLAAEPKNDSTADRNNYVEVMAKLKSLAEEAKSVSDVKALRDKIVYDFIGIEKGIRGGDNKEKTKKYLSIFKGWREDLSVGWNEERKAEQLIQKGFPEDQEPWKRKYMVTKSSDERFVVREAGSFKPIEILATEQEAEDRAKAIYEEKKEKQRETGAMPERPYLDEIERTGKDFRDGKDASAKDFMDTFGFRAVEFGNWVANDERQRVVNLAYDGLYDLSEVLGIPPKAMSLDGRMALAFGARGGGHALAHYEPDRLVINMTKINAAGSLAHEWGHALDHYFGEYGREDAYSGRARGVSGWREHAKAPDRSNLRPEMAEAFDDLMTAIFSRYKEKAEVVRDKELRLEKEQKRIASWEKFATDISGLTYAERIELDKLTKQKQDLSDEQLSRLKELQDKKKPTQSKYRSELQKADFQIEQGKKFLPQLEESLAKAREEPFSDKIKTESSFYQNAQKLSGKSGKDGYWARPTEMFARAFESYVFDEIQNRNLKSQYLVQGVEADRHVAAKGNPYPVGMEREKINAAFDNLFKTMKTKETENGKVALFSVDEGISQKPFYSALQRSIENIKQEKAVSRQWIGIINNLTQKGVKQEEIEWSGIQEWLSEQQGTVSRQAILDYLKANELQIQEVMKEYFEGRDVLEIRRNPSNRLLYDVIDGYGSVVKANLSQNAAGEFIDNYNDGKGDTKFAQWQLEGDKTGYREMLLTLPETKADIDEVSVERFGLLYSELSGTQKALLNNEMNKQDFRSPHFEEPNIVAHIRFNERTDAEGKRVLFIEEIQSDWHQKGRKSGYADKNARRITQAERKEYESLTERGRKERSPDENKRVEELGELIAREDNSKFGQVPDAPFKTTWPGLAFKRALRYAAENGFDKVAWTTGKQQAERYDLSKQVDRVVVGKNENGWWFRADKNQENLVTKEGLSHEVLSENIGKDLSQKALNDIPEKGGQRAYVDADLKVGGEGMRRFYDDMLPKMVNKLTKKWGGKVGETSLETSRGEPSWNVYEKDGTKIATMSSETRAIQVADEVLGRTYRQETDVNREGVHSIDITDIMRESVMQGQPLFAVEGKTFSDKIDVQKISRQIQDRLKSVGWPNIKVELHDTLTVEDKKIAGAYWNGIIHLSLTKGNPVENLDHELIHALREVGAFSGAEWRVLMKNAKEEWRSAFGIDEKYGFANLDEAQLNEEAVAYAFREYGREAKGVLGRIVLRIARFFKFIKEVFTGQGFTKAEDVFGDIILGKKSEEKTYKSRENPIYSLDGDAEKQTKNVKERTEILERGIKAIERAERLSSVRGIDRTVRDDLATASVIASHPQQISIYWDKFTPAYVEGKKMFQDRDTLVSEMTAMINPYTMLKEKERDRVNAALELGRLQGIDIEDKKVSITNENQKDALLSQPGDKFALSEKESEAYHAIRTAMNFAIQTMHDQVLRDYGLWDKDIRTQADLESYIATVDEKDPKMPDLKNALQMLEDINGAKKTGYIPFSRFGNIGIVVKKTKDKTTYESENAETKIDTVGDVVYFTKLDTEGVISEAKKTARSLHLYKGKTKLGEIKQVSDALDFLREQYPEEDYDISVFEIEPNPTLETDATIRDFESLISSLNKPGASIKDDLAKIQELNKKMGFRAHFFKAQNTPGYTGDFERAINSYIVQFAGYISKREHMPTINKKIAEIPNGQTRLKKYAQIWIDYVTKPQEEFRLFRNIMFIKYIAGRISTAMANLMQTQIITFPYLSMFTTKLETQKAIVSAYKDVLKMAVSRKDGKVHFFDLSKAPDDIRDEIIEAEKKGMFLPLNSYEAMAAASTNKAALRGYKRQARNALEIFNSPFGGAERFNRMASWIAAYRISTSPEVKNKIRKVLAGDALARTEVLSGGDVGFSSRFADHATMTTQFFMSRLNRPVMARGYGTLPFQFRSYSMQSVELLMRMIKLYGEDGRNAAGLYLIMHILLAGLIGIPFADDLKEIVEAIYRGITKTDFDIETKLREAAAKIFGADAAAAIVRGVPMALPEALAVDVSGKVGLGNVIPDVSGSGVDVLGKMALGVSWDATVGTIKRMAKYASEGRYGLAAMEPLPNALVDIAKAIDMQGGISTAYGRPVATADQVTVADSIKKAIGFQSANLSNIRAADWAERRAEKAVNELRSTYYRRLAIVGSELTKANIDGDEELALEKDKEMQRIYDEIDDHNQNAQEYEKIKINSNTLKKKIGEILYGKSPKSIRKQARSRAEELKDIYGVE